MAYTEIKFNIHQLGFKTRFYHHKTKLFERLMSDTESLEKFIPRSRINTALKSGDLNDLEIIYNDLIIEKLKWLPYFEIETTWYEGYDSIYRNVSYADDPKFELVQVIPDSTTSEIEKLIKSWDKSPVEGSVANVENYTCVDYPSFIPGTKIIVKNYTISVYPGNTRIQFVKTDYVNETLKY